ncbi:YihY/virulence factor BrkB family protein [Nordella sp. HKS 07]|uniref:YihY/virulence factor BrkB family protein n=1 Tax=Nordella sp. HKS 07 TaxID=2712222 RepID=UPI001FEE2A36|nr:YihY/virulence factor BrkB family protein [Nordella sp. HKS 07]
MAHKVSTLGAALAYYSLFSIGPLMVIAIAVAGLVFGEAAVRGQVSQQLSSLIGDEGAKGVQQMLLMAGKPTGGVFATIIATGALIYAAIGVVVQLKDALNTVWGVKAPASSGIWSFLRIYGISLAGVLSLGFLLLVSLLLTTALSAVGPLLSEYVSEVALQVAGFAISFTLTTVLFAMMFKWLPDIEIEWRVVVPGGLLTAALFEIGKLLIGLYIGKQGLESTYGAAASFVVVLIWVYYSAQLVLFGAEFTRAYAQKMRPRRVGRTETA